MNREGLELLKSLEGCRLTAYKLKGEKYYTIGYGHYGADVKKDMTITQQEAEELFLTDLKKYEKHVDTYAVKKFGSLTENQHAALTSYCYNRGAGGLKELVNNSGSITELGNNFPKYWGSNETYKTALINRRKKEQTLFFKGAAQTTPATNASVCYPRYAGTSNYLDTIFKIIGAPYGNVAKRRPVAVANGISNYSGTYSQNIQLIRLAKQGNLRRA